MSQRPTSLIGLLAPSAEHPEGRKIEIPLIQRDYAQGRREEAVDEIREDFVTALCAAVTAQYPKTLELDLVYGGEYAATLHPLDGQQRLTALFLLHWYVATRAKALQDAPWLRLTYATRPSARRFCERLIKEIPPADLGGKRPSRWITDQHWYHAGWRHDPTIQSMLVVLDEIHRRFKVVAGKDDWSELWLRLVRPESPAITMIVHWVDDLPNSSDLYIKMNSRGKPLTRFENFKAHLLRSVSTVFPHDGRNDTVAKSLDKDWHDIFWPLRGDDDMVDDEFLRYLAFVIQICEWRSGISKGSRSRLEHRWDALLAQRSDETSDQPTGDRHYQFLIDALDAWLPPDGQLTEDRDHTEELFDRALATPGTDYNPDTQVVLHFGEGEAHLFRACCLGKQLTLAQSLMLYGLIAHLILNRGGGAPDVAPRLRVLRNLIEASESQVRDENMPQLIKDVDVVMSSRPLDYSAIQTFNRDQVDDEQRKAMRVADEPQVASILHALEDHPLLRGTLSAFELDLPSDRLRQQAAAFRHLFADTTDRLSLTGAMLAIGEYQRKLTNSDIHLFGTPSTWADRPWRQTLTGASRGDLSDVRKCLGTLLDGIPSDPADEDALTAYLQRRQTQFLDGFADGDPFDWRRYMVTYSAMRQATSGRYYPGNAPLGYSLCMLRTDTPSGKYHDPYLMAIVELSALPTARFEDLRFRYYGTPRWLEFKGTGVQVRCVDRGYEVRRPDDDETAAVLQAGLEGFAEGPGLETTATSWLLPVRQDHSGLDLEDRVALGARLLVTLASLVVPPKPTAESED